MGKYLKRVPLGFDHPINEPWGGYLNPHYAEQQDCPTCRFFGRSSGHTPSGELLYDLWYRHRHDQAAAMLETHVHPYDLRTFARFILESGAGWMQQIDDGDVAALMQQDRLWDFTRRQLRPDQETWPNGWTKEWNGYTPTAAEVNGAYSRRMGHDALNAGICVRARADRYGVPAWCLACDGHGTVRDLDLEARIEAWEKTEPPEGDGFQLWQNTSEDSPISPVFETLDTLCRWAEQHATTFAYDRATAAEWEKMLNGGIVHSKVGNNIFL